MPAAAEAVVGFEALLPLPMLRQSRQGSAFRYADQTMQILLRFARAIDALNARLGRIAVWLVLAACAVSAGNAVSRYAFDISSNAWLELQWYLFTGIVMLGAPYVLNVNGHVRVDILYGRRTPRARAWIDLLGLVFFLLPVMAATAVMAWPFFIESFELGEVSPNAGGLLRWPVKLLIPVGFGLTALQGLSEAIKRIAYLRGKIELAAQYERPLQ